MNEPLVTFDEKVPCVRLSALNATVEAAVVPEDVLPEDDPLVEPDVLPEDEDPLEEEPEDEDPLEEEPDEPEVSSLITKRLIESTFLTSYVFPLVTERETTPFESVV